MPTVQDQRLAWDDWNARGREHRLSPVSERQAQVVLSRVACLGQKNLRLIDVGCGAGWLCERLQAFGEVTGTDFASEVLDRARQRVPAAQFIAGNFFELELSSGAF